MVDRWLGLVPVGNLFTGHLCLVMLPESAEPSSLAVPISLPNPSTLCDQFEPQPTPLPQSHQSGPLGVSSLVRRAGSSWSMSPPPLSPPLSPFHPPSPLHTMPQSDVSQVVEAVQKMEAGIVAAINDMKVALLGKLEHIWMMEHHQCPGHLSCQEPLSALAVLQPSPSIPQLPSNRPLPHHASTSNGDSPRWLPI
ncbi:hypothetical protein EMCRGX_G006946 [Ephydatia muelleri]